MVNRETLALVPRVREWRNLRGATIADVAAAVGCSGAHVSQIERGLKRPSLETLFAIARALDVSVRDLYSDAPPPVEP